jgi:hypothetical protein
MIDTERLSPPSAVGHSSGASDHSWTGLGGQPPRVQPSTAFPAVTSGANPQLTAPKEVPPRMTGACLTRPTFRRSGWAVNMYC